MKTKRTRSSFRSMNSERRLESIFLFVTGKCNAKCAMCFYANDMAKKERDLTFEEIILLLTLMGSCIYATISLTLEICRISFEKQKRPLTISHVSGHNNCPPNIATTIKNSHTK